MPDDSLKQRLLEAALPAVPFDGWTQRLLRDAAMAVGVSEAEAQDAFPGGPIALLAFFSHDLDHRMLRALEARDLGRMRIRERIATAVRTRLELAAPHREAMRRGLALLSLPTNAPLGARLVWRSVDAIWHAAGDTATDYNFYTKRGLLAGLLSGVTLYWLNDQSENTERTWEMLERRIDDIMRIEAAKRRVIDLADRLPSPLALLARLRYPPSRTE
ncbi:COQ9 family protein [Zavarzinia sp. CC-PAN008]|uniref:COQ9 family protein n=1 Tax=Zavarzinia sp. CC-PAN008 TaxID=3243332 RepID=UPI003F74538A